VAERQNDLKRDGHQGTPCAKSPVGPDPLHSVARPREVKLINRKASPVLSSKRRPPNSHCHLPGSQVSMAYGRKGSQGATLGQPRWIRRLF
jgi:hypothetical protein